MAVASSRDREEFQNTMAESVEWHGVPAAPADVASAEEHPLRSAWAAAWLREYRCHARYAALLALDAVEEFELRFAWLDWWHATCACREALRRYESSIDTFVQCIPRRTSCTV